MNLLSLKPIFPEEKLQKGFNKEQIDAFYEIFTSEFIDNTLIIKGKKIKIASFNSKVEEFKAYNETFYHIVTRETSHGRIYTAERANRIHWIKPILENADSKSIHYYKWKDDKNICKEHFWFFKKDFMVVLKTISTDLMIVTAFCVDKDEQSIYYERYKNYKEGNGTC
jgi:hypothetical protein